MRTIIVLLTLLLCCGFAVAEEYLSVTDWQLNCILSRTQLELHLNPAYVWGAAGLEPGAPGDCSGKLYAIFRSCGIPVERVPVSWIAQGKGGWKFALVGYDEARSTALNILTLQPRRPKGHIGLFITDVSNGKTTMAHASSKWGFIGVLIDKSDPHNYWFPRIDQILQVDSRK